MLGPLVAQALGDAYGAGFEYAPENAHLNDLTHFPTHPRLPLGGGRYTDDTQMSLAIVGALLDKSPWTKVGLARLFLEVFQRDPRPGYSSAFYAILQRADTVEDFLTAVVPASEKNGAAMRAPIIGLLPDTQDVADYAAKQAAVTHDTLVAKSAAVAAALLTHYFHYRLGPKRAVGLWLDDAVPDCLAVHGVRFNYRWSEPWSGAVSGFATDAVRAAVSAVTICDTLSDLLKMCVAFGGDVDTVAAIAMPAASRSVEIRDDIPTVLVDQLEDGSFGRSYLRALDYRLLTAWPGAAR